jgi:hypothetical protein
VLLESDENLTNVVTQTPSSTLSSREMSFWIETGCQPTFLTRWEEHILIGTCTWVGLSCAPQFHQVRPPVAAAANGADVTIRSLTVAFVAVLH